ncbi:hypothetical protein G6011_05301 [Alternaria panax]|uniref:Phosphoglycerate mutase family protein n=1 Tax=Alternaria panax TaxID=48097 RepID=A0AAD4FDJ1_9PLEO|nr:hypothetical protein G6011_05301 [Alternaria panax]
MAKGPAVVVVARHGARLDAADKSWHLTSPTPYDPPLTYGGWSQAKALGQRIAALLHERDMQQAEDAKNATTTDPAHVDLSKLSISEGGEARGDGRRRPKKKRKIVIHSSPFLRCVQTSTAVAAGISQYHAPTTPQLGVPASPSKEKSGSLAPSARKAPRTKSTTSQPRSFEPLADPTLEIFPRPHTGPERVLLRIDAFLGEWLSPEYYADITAPPNSTMMVAGAKADLLRRGDYIQEQPNPNSSKGNFPGGWMGNKASGISTPTAGKGAATAMGSLAQFAPLRERSSSYAGPLGLERTPSKEATAPLAMPTQTPKPTAVPNRVYEPPHPSYSVSPADPIPRGYVAHAQDACVKVDFQWDSMRPPQNWGDGGEYGDEWNTMHKRFRRGLAGMMEWYKTHGTAPPKNQFPGFMFKEPLRLTPPPKSPPKSDPFPNFTDDQAEDDDEELVLVLITHGAGCNALIGAMTNQPVLMDIGLASLSMAVRRDEPKKTSAPATIHQRRLSVADPGMSDTYDMKLSASVDHLRPGIDPSKLPSAQTQTQSPAITGNPSLEYRRRFTGSSTTSSPLDSPFSLGEPYRNSLSSLGSMRRTMSSGSNSRFMQSATSGTASPAGGLWSGSGTSTPATEADMVLNSSNHHPQPKAAPAASAASKSKSNSIAQVDGASDTSNYLTRLDSKEEREVHDKPTPLVSAQVRKQSAPTASGGLWGAKAAPKSNTGLWGPPKLDDVYEHRQGPKRRWTVTEREEP